MLAAILQQQLAQVGIALDLRSYEYATFYSDVTRGAFQMYSLRWIGGNEQPDIFSYVLRDGQFFSPGRQSRPLLESAAGCAADRCGRERRYGPAARRLRRSATNSGARFAGHQSLVPGYGGGAQPAADARGSYGVGKLFFS